MNDTIIDRIYNIVMADLAGTDIQGGTDMTEAEKRGVYMQFRYEIDKARCISDYFKQYIDEDNAKNTDGLTSDRYRGMGYNRWRQYDIFLQ